MKTHGTEHEINWVELLAYTAAGTGGTNQSPVPGGNSLLSRRPAFPPPGIHSAARESASGNVLTIENDYIKWGRRIFLYPEAAWHALTIATKKEPASMVFMFTDSFKHPDGASGT